MSKHIGLLLMVFSIAGHSTVFSKLKEPKVLIIGVDGTRTDALKKARTTHFDRLIDKGLLVQDMHILSDKSKGADTVSGPGWSNILTGVWPAKHQVKNNSFKRNNLEEYPHFFVHLKKYYPQAVTASLVSWKPIQTYIVRGADLNIFRSSSSNVGDIEIASHKLDGQINEEAIKIIGREDDLTAMFVYFHQVDEIGHGLGFDPNNPSYIKAIENVDHYVGKLTNALTLRNRYENENWLIVVCTDHGGWKRNHSKGHKRKEVAQVFTILSGSSVDQEARIESSYLPDITATVVKHLGLSLPENFLDGSVIGLKNSFM